MDKKAIYERYRKSDNYCLWHVYERFSREKEKAWEYCEELLKKKDGHGLKVIGANTCFFSAGFEFEENGKNKFMYITHANDYEWEV